MKSAKVEEYEAGFELHKIAKHLTSRLNLSHAFICLKNLVE
jgi:hypothetical protein